MKKGLRPVSEAFEYTGIMILFFIVWLVDGYFILKSNTGQMDFYYLLIGALILGYGLVQILKAYKTRIENNKIVESVKPIEGRIIRAEFKEDVRGLSLDEIHRKRRRPRYFFLEIETPDLRGISKIDSDGFIKPIHKYLKSDKVLVYHDPQTGRKVVRGFEWKDSKDEPDVIHIDGDYPNPMIRTIALVVLVLSMLFVLVAIYWVKM